MVELCSRITGGQRYISPNGKGPYDYASFVINSKFYKHAASKIGCSEIYIRKHIQAFCDFKFIIKLGKNGRYGGNLYADGYYVKSKVGLRKILFLKDSKEYKTALQQFRPKGI
jgi:hypothetical protein